MAGVAQRLVLVDVDRRHAGAARAQRIDQRARLDQRRAAGVDEERGRLHAREVGGGDDAARRVDQAHVQRDDVAFLEERLLAARGGVAVGARLRQRRLARPHQHVHAERLAVARDDAADPAVAVDAERLAAQRAADADLPLAGLERRHLLRNLPHRREDQPPGQLGGRVGRRAGVLVRRHDDAEPRAGLDVDVRIDAALADELELGQALEQRRADLACARGSAPAPRCPAAARRARRRPGRDRSRS